LGFDDSLVNEAVRLVENAESAKIILRMLGATAIRLHCPKNQKLFETLNRKITDIDFAAYGKQKSAIAKFISEHGYKQPQHLTIGAFVDREIFEGADGKHIDVFFDKLEFCHTIFFSGRLENDRPTVPLSELLLEKMQIVQINEKDLKDTTVMLLEHDIGDGDGDVVNSGIIAKTLASEWGFYYTVTMNLSKVKNYVEKFPWVSQEDAGLVKTRIDKLLECIEREPKSMGWKMRAKVGPKKKWYRDVEEVDRAEWLTEHGQRC
jgi:hypothetical protein